MKAADSVSVQPAETFAERIQYCRMMLHLHGFLSDGEDAKVRARQVKRDVLPPGAIVVGRDGKPLGMIEQTGRRPGGTATGLYKGK